MPSATRVPAASSSVPAPCAASGFRLSVADDGRGMTGDWANSGFGMTSMRERAEHIGASLTFVTAPRAGTEVVLAWQPASFTIPRARRCRPLIPERRRPPSATLQARVLVVDDHSLLRTGVANIINQEPGFEVVAEAANGLEAIEAFISHRPDVVLMDLRMPEMEGVEAVRRIRRDRSARARRRADDLRRGRRHRARPAGRGQGLYPQGHRRRSAGRVHPRRARRARPISRRPRPPSSPSA